MTNPSLFDDETRKAIEDLTARLEMVESRLDGLAAAGRAPKDDEITDKVVSFMSQLKIRTNATTIAENINEDSKQIYHRLVSLWKAGKIGRDKENNKQAIWYWIGENA